MNDELIKTVVRRAKGLVVRALTPAEWPDAMYVTGADLTEILADELTRATIQAKCDSCGTQPARVRLCSSCCREVSSGWTSERLSDVLFSPVCGKCGVARPCRVHDRPEGSGIVPYAHPRDEMRYQILRVGAEYFRFVRDEAHMIRQFNSYDEAVEEVKGALMKAEADGEYVIVTVHRCFKHTTTYPKVDPIHEIKEYGLSEV